MTGRVIVRGLLAYALIGLVAQSLLSGAVAQTEERETVTAPIFKGAWFARAEPCLSVIDCAILPPISPYPEDTLHVALSGGEETARSYVALSFLLPPDAELLGGELELPIDTDPSHGSVAPETADLIACLTDHKFKPVRGSLEKPPATKCALRKGAIYDEEKEVFTVDLNRFLEEWEKKGIAALALRPSESALAGNESWHVVFPADEQAEDDAPIIEATLVYTAPADTTGGFGFNFGPEPEPEPANQGSSSVSSFSPPSFDTAAPSSVTQTETTPSTPPSTSQPVDPQPLSAVAAPTAGFAGEGFAYPIIWAFPLVLLVGYGLVGRALTKEL
ncbi:MAG TPA: hypothetical protein VG408_05480 [Actinomycetota bacterium]|nr:hypothetical protein [Actinomycetota bacterium]